MNGSLSELTEIVFVLAFETPSDQAACMATLLELGVQQGELGVRGENNRQRVARSNSLRLAIGEWHRIDLME